MVRVSGVVYLVGAGPGDPELITVRGLRLLQQADVVVHDRLGTEGLLVECRADAALVNAGKAPGDVAMTQDQINAALLEHARAGKTVVRLKGGDPFVFGRGGEEALACSEAGIPWVVVPGLTSAIAAPASGGIPVTHRAVATSFTVITGHEDPTKPSEQTDWPALARVPGTLVILMGMGRLARISAALVAGGRSPDQPAAAVQWGTTPRQRRVVATLATLADECSRQGVGSPAVVVVGDVAGLGIGTGAGPLAGSRVVVTRARAQASDLSSALRALGADVIELPVIRIEPVKSSDEIDAAVAQLGDYDLVILTSANGVDCLFDRLAERDGDARRLSGAATVVAIGPATASRLADRGVVADLVPERFVAEGILDALAQTPTQGKRVLVARARESRPDLVDGLRARGAHVDEVALYDTVSEAAPAVDIEAALSADYLTFTSSSTVRNFMALLDDEGRRRAAARRVVSIGPITSDTARAEGLTVHREAEEFTIPGLIAALCAECADRP
jgi:uroporphyrinogen III methyltransferase / synthase